MSRILRCAGCTRRIKAHHPHIGVEEGCMTLQRLMLQTGAR